MFVYYIKGPTSTQPWELLWVMVLFETPAVLSKTLIHKK